MTLYISILAAFLSLLLIVFNWKQNKNSIYLAAFFIIISNYSITHHFIYFEYSIFWTAIFYNHFAALWLLTGPMLYFYIRGILYDNSKLTWKDSWHFVPAIIQLVNTLPYFAKSFDYKLKLATYFFNDINRIHTFNFNWLYPPIISITERLGSLILYSLYLFWLLYKEAPSRQNFSKKPISQYILSYRWILILNILAFTIAICYSLLTFSVIIDEKSILLINSDPLNIIMCVAFLLIPISLLIYPQVLYGIPIIENVSTQPFIKQKNKSKEKNIVETNEPDPFEALGEKIMNHLEKEKPYLNPDFSLTQISLALQVPQHHVYYCFNNILKIKFPDLKNQLRVEYAKDLINSGITNEITIEGIAQSAGFASKSNFYTVFKSQIGMTPHEYIKQLKN